MSSSTLKTTFVLLIMSLLISSCGKEKAEEKRTVAVATSDTGSSITVPTNEVTPPEEGQSAAPVGIAPGSCSNWNTNMTIPNSYKNIRCSGTKIRYCLGGSLANPIPGPEAKVTLYYNQHGSKITISKTADNRLRGVMAEICSTSTNVLTRKDYDLEVNLNNPFLDGEIRIPGVIQAGDSIPKTLYQTIFHFQTIYATPPSNFSNVQGGGNA